MFEKMPLDLSLSNKIYDGEIIFFDKEEYIILKSRDDYSQTIKDSMDRNKTDVARLDLVDDVDSIILESTIPDGFVVQFLVEFSNMLYIPPKFRFIDHKWHYYLCSRTVISCILSPAEDT